MISEGTACVSGLKTKSLDSNSNKASESMKTKRTLTEFIVIFAILKVTYVFSQLLFNDLDIYKMYYLNLTNQSKYYWGFWSTSGYQINV